MLMLESRCKAWQTKKPQVGDVDAPSKTKTTVTNWYCCSKMSLAKPLLSLINKSMCFN